MRSSALFAAPALAALMALAACDDAPDTPGDRRMGSANPYAESETYRFLCGEREVEARFLRETARIVVDSQTYDLDRVDTETGTRFEAPGDDALFFWNMGEAAVLGLPGDTDRDCRLDGEA
ncbi:MAG: MliC family protein [Oceanicaulis sp.]